MVLKGGILSGIKNLQQRGGWVAMKTSAELVDFIQHEDGISTAGLADGLNNVARERPDVSSPVAANIRLVMDAVTALFERERTMLEGAV